MHSVGRRVFAGGVVLAAVASGAVISRADGAQSKSGGPRGRPEDRRSTGRSARQAPASLGHDHRRQQQRQEARHHGRGAAVDAVGHRRDEREPPRRRSPASPSASSSFSLAPGAQTVVDVNVTTGASLYGAVEVVGIPSDASYAERRRASATGSLNCDPAGSGDAGLQARRPARRRRPAAAPAKQLVLPLKNAGNTVAPVSGDVSLKGALGTRQRDLSSVRILPGKTIDVLLSSTKSLKAGSYTATVALKQGGIDHHDHEEAARSSADGRPHARPGRARRLVAGRADRRRLGRRGGDDRAARAVHGGVAGGPGRVQPRRGRVSLPPRRGRARSSRAPAARAGTRLAGGRHLRPARQGPAEPDRPVHVRGARASRARRCASAGWTRSTARRCSTSSPTCASSRPRGEVRQPAWVGELMAGYF